MATGNALKRSAETSPKREFVARSRSPSTESEALIRELLCDSALYSRAPKGAQCARHFNRKATILARGEPNATLCLDCAMFVELRAAGGVGFSAEQREKAWRLLSLHDRLLALATSNAPPIALQSKNISESFSAIERDIQRLLKEYTLRAKCAVEEQIAKYEQNRQLIDNYVDDIRDNFKDIVTCIEMSSFEEIMTDYGAELEKLQEKIAQFDWPKAAPIDANILRRRFSLCFGEGAPFEFESDRRRLSAGVQTENSFRDFGRETESAALSGRTSAERKSAEVCIYQFNGAFSEVKASIARLCQSHEAECTLKAEHLALARKVNDFLDVKCKFGKLSSVGMIATELPKLRESFIRHNYKFSGQSKRHSNDVIAERLYGCSKRDGSTGKLIRRASKGASHMFNKNTYLNT